MTTLGSIEPIKMLLSTVGRVDVLSREQIDS